MRRAGVFKTFLVVLCCSCGSVASISALVLLGTGCSGKKSEHGKPQQLQITTTSLPDAYDGQTGYSAQLTATGGTGTYTWSVTGTLPSNLSLNNDTISGDVAANASQGGTGGVYDITVAVTDGTQTVQADLSITVWPQLQITTASLPEATEEQAYGPEQVQATGGDSGSYQWSATGLPTGLSINQTTGEVSGTPAAGTAGTYTVDVTVDDGLQTANAQFDLVVNAPPLVADFEATPTSGTAPLDVNFTDLSTPVGGIVSWEWDFDNDGTVDSTVQNPTHTYGAAGWYSVKLTVSDGTGSDTCVKEQYILVANNIWFVDGGVASSGDGTSWTTAFKTIGEGITAAGDYDLVLIADGTYTGTGNKDLDFGGWKIYLKGTDHNNPGQRPVIDCEGSRRAFIFNLGETKETVIDNLTIQNGVGSGAGGGAIYCYKSSPVVTNCTFSSNTASDSGGAIHCHESSPTIRNCMLQNNTATNNGGAIHCGNSSSPTIQNCTFINNSVTNYWGGAINCDSSSPTIKNCTFTNNSAALGILSGAGGAIHCIWNSSCPNIIDCTFEGNSSTYGGAIEFHESSPVITNCTFNSNSAEYGSAISYHDGTALAMVTNCTFSSNSSTYVGTIHCRGTGSAVLNNCILWGNSATSGGNEIHIEDASASCTLNYCCVDNTGYGGQTGNIYDTNNCIFVDPQFVDAANGDYHLKNTSPCIDAGDNSYVPSGVTTDLDGNPRIVNGTVDMGAYEYQP